MLDNSSEVTLKNLVEKRNIPYLVHFTQTANLPSILEYGIYPVLRHGELPARPLVNDLLRLDEHRDANCISIAFPNSSMFYKYRCDLRNAEWAVMKLDRSILWNKNCAYCRHNAASGDIRRTKLDELMTPEAFSGMFDEIAGCPSRAEQHLWSYDPTDVQAEVLVFDIIEPNLVREIAFSTSGIRNQFRNLQESQPRVRFGTSEMFFAERNLIRDRG